MRVIGTAGHVDHGKSTLVQALTGIHPDRLKEEREREMTIDLGFAFFNLLGGEEIGIVDVPGHRDFIENMLSGVGGIDAALFVIAADEGVMPQTREHLAILDLLQIPGGLIALTKIDLAPDPEWIDLVEQEVRTVLKGTVLENAPIVRVSARTGLGVPDVISGMAGVLSERPAKSDLGRPRLPIDRVFSMPGFGTVVTGTLVDGRFETGLEVEIQPEGVRARIRGLQMHNRKTSEVDPGTRTAVNLSGIRLNEVNRGSWIVLPDTYPATRRLDLQIRLLPDAQHPLKHNDEVKFFIGAAEIMGRARVLGVETLQPGENGWIQLELKQPVIARRGDRFIIRRPSPGETIGGGSVVDPAPLRRHKRFSDSLILRLEALAGGTPKDVLLEALASLGETTIANLSRISSLSKDVLDEMIPALIADREIILLDEKNGVFHSASTVADLRSWQLNQKRLVDEIGRFHERFPLRSGMPREETRSRFRGSQAFFNAIIKSLVADEIVSDNRSMIALAEHKVRFTGEQNIAIEKLMSQISASPFSPPALKEIREQLGEDLAAALIDMDLLVQVNQEVVFRREDYETMLSAVREMIGEAGSITVGQFRDRFANSRKYALGFLEHLDSIGITVRDGDGRRLK